ncbi:hypothetical protein BZG02_16280 [Labilibaculum filiforme]|uniref:Uncharacterized protein n=1 Tax=Labilibaculum filiforme TaxID=1940526 RepID=A0A2N3HTH5_9BACT|nr:hypothetical protein BZG02_16280 [Labilibaculum filiforme]
MGKLIDSYFVFWQNDIFYKEFPVVDMVLQLKKYPLNFICQVVFLNLISHELLPIYRVDNKKRTMGE